MTVGDSRRWLGSYDTPEEAAAAFEAEARKLHGEFYREPEYIAKLMSLTPKRRSHIVGASGFQGVRRSGKVWVAYFNMGGGRQCHLGRFKTPEVAHAAHLAGKELFELLRRLPLSA
jgi:hypothetical protein